MGIGCEQYFCPIHVQPYIQEMLDCRKGDYPVCERVSDRTIALPFYTSMSEQQVRRVAESLKSVLAARGPGS